MPRPALKRRHLQRNGPTPRSPRMSARIPKSGPARDELRQKLAKKPIAQRPEDSDDSDRLVVRGPSGRRGRVLPAQEIYASGAVGVGDKPGAFPTSAQRRRSLRKETERLLADGAQNCSQKERRSTDSSPLTNGISMRNKGSVSATPAPAVPSSAVKLNGGILRSAQPTPLRENSILGTLNPRRRQPSMLRELDQDSSSFDLDDEEHFLPDDESTPLNVNKAIGAASTPATNSTQASSSRKRKLGQAEPEREISKTTPRSSLHSSPPVQQADSQKLPSPAPPALVSILRTSGRNGHRDTELDDDIMALPQSSSSSEPPSPEKPKITITTAKKLRKQSKHSKPVTQMTTEELLAAAMPTKRRRTVRPERMRAGTFDIPSDSTSTGPHGEDDESFLPRQSRRRATRVGETGFKPPGRGRAKSTAAPARAKKSQSRSHLTQAPTAAPVCSPPLGRTQAKSRSQSQLSGTSGIVGKNAPGNDSGFGRRTRAGARSLGGSRRGKIEVEADGDKENLGGGGGDEDNVVETIETGHDNSDVLETTEMPPRFTAPKAPEKSKWDEIDAWDMEFEDVEASHGSSPMLV